MGKQEADAKFEVICKFLFRLYNKQYQQIESLVGNKKGETLINNQILLENLELFSWKPKVIRDRVLLALGLTPGKHNQQIDYPYFYQIMQFNYQFGLSSQQKLGFVMNYFRQNEKVIRKEEFLALLRTLSYQFYSQDTQHLVTNNTFLDLKGMLTSHKVISPASLYVDIGALQNVLQHSALEDFVHLTLSDIKVL